MKYIVYRNIARGVENVATTLYIEDARAILDRWYSGYITDRDGNKIESKR